MINSSSVLKIIIGTPIWVWCVLAYLFFVGFAATKTRVVYIPKFFIIPFVLFILKYKIFMASSYLELLSYFAFLFLSSFISYKVHYPKDIFIIKEKFSVKVSGSYNTLIVLLAFFSVKYIFGYIKATNFEYYQDIQIFELIIGALLTGYFLGKSICYLVKYNCKSS